MSVCTAVDVYDSLALGYDSVFVCPAELAEDWAIFALFREAFGEQVGRVLDLGCGTGLVREHLNCDSYVGLDGAPRMIDVARQKFDGRENISFVLGNMVDVGKIFAQDSFDVVVSTFSFPYCLDPGKVSAGIKRVLKPGGGLFLMAYTPRYCRRPSHTTPDLPFLVWSVKSLREMFGWLRDFSVVGCDCTVRKLERLVPQTLLNRLVFWESKMGLPWHWYYSLIVVGRNGTT